MTARAVALFVLAVSVTAAASTAPAESTRAQLREFSAWNLKVDSVTRSASALVGRTDRLDALTRQVADDAVPVEEARLMGAAVISDLRGRLEALRARARALPPPPVTADRALNEAGQAKRQYAETMVMRVAGIIDRSQAIYDDALAGDRQVEKPLYLKFSHQMIVLLEAENHINRTAIASQPTEPLHPQYHLLSCVVETNEAMMAVWRAVIDVSRGQNAGMVHAAMQRRILRADRRVRELSRKGREQVAVYRRLFGADAGAGRYPAAQIELLNRMMDTYDPAYDIEERIAAALVDYAGLPDMAGQTEAHRRRAEEILGSIGPLAEERERLQAQRTRLAADL